MGGLKLLCCQVSWWEHVLGEGEEARVWEALKSAQKPSSGLGQGLPLSLQDPELRVGRRNCSKDPSKGLLA